jgi:hypothetical protein
MGSVVLRNPYAAVGFVTPMLSRVVPCIQCTPEESPAFVSVSREYHAERWTQSDWRCPRLRSRLLHGVR